MIDISKLDEADKGVWMQYNDGMTVSCNGKIKSWNDNIVFVVFQCDGNWEHYDKYTGEGCSPARLTFLRFSDQLAHDNK